MLSHNSLPQIYEVIKSIVVLSKGNTWTFETRASCYVDETQTAIWTIVNGSKQIMNEIA